MELQKSARHYAEIIYENHRALIDSHGEPKESEAYYCEGLIADDGAGFYPAASAAWQEYFAQRPRKPTDENAFLHALSKIFLEYYPACFVVIIPKKEAEAVGLAYTIKWRRG